MTGPEHYAEAERLIELADSDDFLDRGFREAFISAWRSTWVSAPKREVADRFTAADLGEIEPT
jgi:hypothetical protein